MNQAARSPIGPGDIVAGKYRVDRVLGAGAMGVVVAATHLELRERRALKVMMPEMLSDADSVERFLREARAVAVLRTPFVARVFDTGRLDSGVPYIVMEYLEGSDLKVLLQQRGQLPLAEAAHYFLQICQAVGDAHALGIVHRDLKPANVFITRGLDGSPTVKVLDFGIAKFLKPDDVELTRREAMLGSPLYMSPEQMRSSSTVDARTDVWALGAILYRMLSGRVPFPGESTPEICAAVIADTPTPIRDLVPGLPQAIDAIVMRCLDKQPAGRFKTVGELANAVASALEVQPATAPAPPAAAIVAHVTAAGARAPMRSIDGAGPRSPERSTHETSVNAATSADATARSATWSTVAPAERSRAGTVIALGGLAVAVGAGAAVFFATQRGDARSTNAASATAVPAEIASTATAREPTPSSSTVASAAAIASADPPSAPSSAGGSTSGSVAASPAGPPPRRTFQAAPPTATPSHDAFGKDRK